MRGHVIDIQEIYRLEYKQHRDKICTQFNHMRHSLYNIYDKKKGVEKGKLIQNGQRYRVVGDAIPEVAAEPEVKIEDIKEGSSSEMCDVGDTVVMKYEGKLDDGTIFDSSSNFEFTLGAGEVIKGWDKGK